VFKQAVLIAALSAAIAGPQSAGAAQDYPSRPVTMVVPFAAGGPTDIVARSLAEAMRKPLGQTVVVENLGGAGGTLGTGHVARAAGDGYTLLLMHIGFSTAPALYRKLQYDPIKDFEPVGLAVDVPMTMIARHDFPASSFGEFLSYVRAHKKTLSMANAGIGSASHLCGLLFLSAIDTDVQTIPYKGTAPAMNDMLGKQVDFMCDQTTNTSGQIKADKVKAYAVTAMTRIASLPQLPTMDEAGLKGFEVGIWHGLWAPKGTPKPVIDKLVNAMQAALNDPAFKQRMSDLGAQVEPSGRATPQALDAHVKSEIQKWGPLIRKAGIYAD